MLGAEYVDNSIKNADDFNMPMQELVTEYCWGAGWGRPALSKRDRSLMNLVMIGALNRMHEFRLHLRGAITNGVTKAEIQDALIQLAIYAGIPAGVEAFRIAREVFAAIEVLIPAGSTSATIVVPTVQDDVVEGDDGLLAHYRPEDQGGPIHLINTCLNETRDSDSDLYNADRKGALLTVSWRGMEVGPHEVHRHPSPEQAGTVGQWVAISGAAASPGAGAYTSRGLALLLYFLGIRLGFWVASPIGTPGLRWSSTTMSR